MARDSTGRIVYGNAMRVWCSFVVVGEVCIVLLVVKIAYDADFQFIAYETDSAIVYYTLSNLPSAIPCNIKFSIMATLNVCS